MTTGGVAAAVPRAAHEGRGVRHPFPSTPLPRARRACEVARVTPDEFHDLLRRARLSSPSAFSILVGLDARAGQRWARGDREVLPVPAVALRVLAAAVRRARYGEMSALLRAEADRLDALDAALTADPPAAAGPEPTTGAGRGTAEAPPGGR